MFFPNLTIIIQPMKCCILFVSKKLVTGAHSKKKRKTENLHLFLKEEAKGILRRKSEAHLASTTHCVALEKMETNSRCALC